MIGNLPYVFAFVLSAAFLLLLVTFRSLVIPIKAIVLNLLSVGAAYGLLVLVFQGDWAEGLLGFESNGAIAAWLPLFLFVILFGLSMDYHVFILTRIREAFDRGMTTEDAVAHGIKSTAGVVTSAAIVMVAVFSMFALLERAADEADGHRPRGRRPDRRHDRPRRLAAVDDEAAGRLELVAAAQARLAARGRARGRRCRPRARNALDVHPSHGARRPAGAGRCGRGTSQSIRPSIYVLSLTNKSAPRAGTARGPAQEDHSYAFAA